MNYEAKLQLIVDSIDESKCDEGDVHGSRPRMCKLTVQKPVGRTQDLQEEGTTEGLAGYSSGVGTGGYASWEVPGLVWYPMVSPTMPVES
jgi:hypothetical protein